MPLIYWTPGVGQLPPGNNNGIGIAEDGAFQASVVTALGNINATHAGQGLLTGIVSLRNQPAPNTKFITIKPAGEGGESKCQIAPGGLPGRISSDRAARVRLADTLGMGDYDTSVSLLKIALGAGGIPQGNWADWLCRGQL